MWQTGDWFFHQNNAPAHTVTHFLAKNGMVLLPHAPYLSDLAPCDFFLFPRMKRSMKGHRFDNIEEVMKKIRKELSAVPKDDYKKMFRTVVAPMRQMY